MVCTQLLPQFHQLNPLPRFDGLGIYPYNYLLHWKVLKYLIYIYYGGAIQSEVDPGLNHVIVVWFVPSCYSDSAISAYTHMALMKYGCIHMTIQCIDRFSNASYIYKL